MNNMNKSEWKHYLMQFRLQSSRRKIRMQHEDLEKTLIKLDKERALLYKQKRNLGWIELNPPVMRGWKRYFVLRDDVARSKHADFFQGILDKINTVQHSNTRKFTAKKRKWGRKIQVERDQQLLRPDEYHFRKLCFNEREKQFFYETLSMDNHRHLYKKYVFVEPWRFVLKVRPNMISKTRVRDEAIERRLKEIDQYLEQRDLIGTLGRLLYGRHKYKEWRDSRREKYTFSCKSITKLLDEIKADDCSPNFADELSGV